MRFGTHWAAQMLVLSLWAAAAQTVVMLVLRYRLGVRPSCGCAAARYQEDPIVGIGPASHAWGWGKCAWCHTHATADTNLL